MAEIQQAADVALTFTILGDGVTIDPASGTIDLPADPTRSTIEAVFSVPATVERPRREFLLTIAERPVPAVVPTTAFDSAENLARLGFVSAVAPAWTLDPAGFGRLVPSATSRAHGDWSLAGGDGIYRCLVRWSVAGLAFSLDRRFSFGARITKTLSNWTGIRIDGYSTAAGVPRLHLREYTGAQALTTGLATADVAWNFDAWNWFEVSVAGNLVKARVYPEGAAVPAWQVSASTTQLAGGAFGPGGFPAAGLSPVIDVRRLEYHPPEA